MDSQVAILYPNIYTWKADSLKKGLKSKPSNVPHEPCWFADNIVSPKFSNKPLSPTVFVCDISPLAGYFLYLSVTWTQHHLI